MSTETTVQNLKINKLTKAQFDTITPSATEAYELTDLSSILDSKLQNTATGTGALTINGTATAGSYAVNIGSETASTANYGTAIGYKSRATASSSTAIGRVATSSGAYSIAIGYGATVSSAGGKSIQLGYGTNGTANSLSVGFQDSGNYQMLDGTTGKIPSDRIKYDGTTITVNSNGELTSTGGGGTVDDSLSTTSTNPVQNKLITNALNGKADTDLSNLTSTACTNFDGQWVSSFLQIAYGVTWKTNTAVATYSLASYLPNDNYNYEVLITGTAATGSTSGNFVTIGLNSDLVDNGELIAICEARTRTAAQIENRGNAIIPVGTGRYIKQYSSSSSNANGSYSLYALAYRRIGTNS